MTEVGTPLSDIKAGFSLLRDNFLSFFLAWLLMGVFTMILFVVIAAPVLILILNPIFDVTGYVLAVLGGGSITITPSVIIILAILMFSAFALAGPLYRLARDVLEDQRIYAETIYVYFKENLLQKTEKEIQ